MSLRTYLDAAWKDGKAPIDPSTLVIALRPFFFFCLFFYYFWLDFMFLVALFHVLFIFVELHLSSYLPDV